MEHFEQPGGEVTLSVHPDGETGLAHLLKYMRTVADNVIIIKLNSAETAALQLAWVPTDTETYMNGIASNHASSITGGFVSSAIGPEMNHNGRFLEDRFFSP